MTEEVKVNLKKIIEYSAHIVFFGGAGVSTESGIPDFRSKDGLYNQKDIKFEKYDPEYLLSRDCLYNNPKVFYEFYRQKMDTRNIEPNIVHRVLVDMEQCGKLDAIITQNIDGLHQKAGSKEVYEIHGSTLRNYCPKCGKKYSSDYIFETSGIPKCECRGQIRPDVTLYGEKLPDNALKKSADALNKADCLIIAGTSLSVFPAASLIYQFYGDHIVVINKEKLDISLGKYDLQINESVGEVFQFISEVVKGDFCG